MIANEIRQLENRRSLRQREIDSHRSDAQRNRLGQFATPNGLALDIARYVAKVREGGNDKIRFADPAVGSGSFYSAALEVFGSANIASATGIEIDAEFCDAARALWGKNGIEILQGDFTHIVAGPTRPGAPNLILANPPYVRHHHLTRADKERLHALTHHLTGIDVSGLAGLYVYFLLLATAWMAPGGYAAWLIPSEFMDVNYGAALRKYLTRNVTLHRIHRFAPDDVQFGDAMVSSAAVIFQKKPPPQGHCVQFSLGGSIQNPGAVDAVDLDRLIESSKWTAFPSHVTNDRHASNRIAGPTLSDLFRIRRGIATGCNKFFILDRSNAQRQGIPEQFLRPILPSPRHLKATVIGRDADGYPAAGPQLALINCDLPEHVLRSNHPALWEYLQTAAPLGIRDGYLLGRRWPWYKQERRNPALFLCTYMGRGSQGKQPFRFIWNRSDAIATNLYLMLFPRSVLATMLRDFPDRASDVFHLLNQVPGHELRGEGRVYGGGLNKIEPSELGRISADSMVARWPELRQASTSAIISESLFG